LQEYFSVIGHVIRHFCLICGEYPPYLACRSSYPPLSLVYFLIIYGDLCDSGHFLTTQGLLVLEH
ncbi:MAG: hypothetical protein WBM66_02020, partial [Thiothrix litoralis]